MASKSDSVAAATATATTLLNYLIKRIKEQQQSAADSNNDDENKIATKTAYYNLLKAISSSKKDDLNATDRSKFDSSLFEYIGATINNSVPILKWPFVRALEYPEHYRALLGLPQTLEQTRRWLTTISHLKCKEIMKNLLSYIQERIRIRSEETELLQWVEQVLVYMTGHGRFKKDLQGYNLPQQSKQSVREILNQIRKLMLAETSAVKSLAASAKQQQQKGAITAVFIDRDIRLEEEERQSRRGANFASHIESALEKKKEFEPN